MHVFVPAIGHAHDRRQGHDRPLFAPLHPRQSGAHNAEDALEVDVKRVIPLGIGHLIQRHAVCDAGIGHDHINATMLGFRSRNNGVRRFGRTNVEHMKLSRAAFGHNLGHD